MLPGSSAVFFQAGLIAWAALASPVLAQTSVLTLQKNLVGFGASVGDLGDIDGDGVNDIVAGSPRDSTAGFNAGAVHVFSGATGTVLYTVVAPGFGGYFGDQVVVVGDCNLDGKTDFAVHASVAGAQADVGHVRVYSGANGALLHNLVGTNFFSGQPQFGRAVGACGDFDLDGRADILVSALPTAPWGGVVLVISGANGLVLQSVTGGANDLLGMSVAGLDDVNADGVPDFAASGFQGGGLLRATVYSGATGAVLLNLTFTNSGGAPQLDARGDFNGDGRRDLLISQAYVAIKVVDVPSGLVLANILPLACESADPLCPQDCLAFASKAAVVGDRDGDNLPDIAEYNGRYARWRILSGATGTTLLSITDKGAQPLGLRPLASTQDRDGDGKADLIVGFPNESFSPARSRLMVITAGPTSQGAPMAIGDGTGAPCPCGNPGQAGAGCANSTTLGAALTARGTTSVQFDNLVFETQGIPTGAAALLFLGTGVHAGGLGVPFRDGLLGAGGSLTRVRLRTAPCGTGMDFGPALRPTAQWSSGQSYTAQVWYRDNAGPCGSGSNLTNGLVVTMTP